MFKTPQVNLDSMEDRAVLAGAVRPLEIVGEGASAVVFCESRTGGRAFKVGRAGLGAFVSLREESEWMKTARQVPWVKDHVAKFYRFDAKHNVIVKECVQPRRSPREHGRYSVSPAEAHDFMRQVDKAMLPYGWGAPEAKADSVIATKDRGLVIVDAGFARRVGFRLVEHVVNVLTGKTPRDEYGDSNESLAFYVRTEMDLGSVPRGVGGKLLRRLGA